MIIGYVTERQYSWVPEEEVLRNEAFFAVSNKYFDRKKAADGKDYTEVRRKLLAAYGKAQKDYLMIVGSPKTVIERVKTIMRLLRVSILTVFQVQGTVSNEDRRNSMRLFAQEVAPAIREYAKELDLPDPFERLPGSVKLQAGVARLPVVDRTPLASLKLGV
jgi:hypothetical protein